jgi:stage II sporulation protein D
MKLFLISYLMIAAMLPLNAADQSKLTHQMVRVALLQGVDEISLSITNRYWIEDALTQKIIDKDRVLKNAKVKVEKDGIRIGQLLYRPVKKIRIVPMGEVMITHQGKSRRYRGFVDLHVNSNNQLVVINTLDMETYIKGVLYHEISHRWPLEAMKAQAVAARTYALYQIQTNKKKDFDVTSDTYSQVYGGRSAERYRTNLAIQRTEGKVLVFKGKVLPAYFHATCGGHTENAAELWQHDLEPLKGAECEYCTLSPHYKWKKNFRSKDIQEKLLTQGYKVGLIQEVKVIERSDSGRVKMLQIISRDGKPLNISGKDFRQMIGPNNLKSNKYDIKMLGYYFDVIGHGWGHGVGMCQWGAYFMSREQYNYDEILSLYYPGAELIDYRKIIPVGNNIRK